MSRELFLKCMKKSGSKEKRTVSGVNERTWLVWPLFSVRLERQVWKVKPKWQVVGWWSFQ